MSFILNLARRELRSSWRRLLFFFLCIGVGVGSIVADSIVSVRASTTGGRARLLIFESASAPHSRVVSTCTSAVISERASPATARLRF